VIDIELSLDHIFHFNVGQTSCTKTSIINDFKTPSNTPRTWSQATMAPQSNFISSISIIYRYYFLFFEPLAALGGTYLCFFHPERFLSGTVPVPALTAAPIPLTPILEMMLRNIGCLYVLFAINEGIVLRLTKERNVWFGIIMSMIAADVGHCKYAF
jgi:hypothetical protein